MPTSPPIRFAVISDPHALAGDEHRHETATLRQTANDPTRNPFAAVRELIEGSLVSEEPLRADAVLCPGDMAHRMSEPGLEYAWEEMEAIAKLLGAPRIIATAGNHDVIRKEDLPDKPAAGAWVKPLRDLHPPFPTHREGDREPYFNDDFIIANGDGWRVVTLNSCAFYTEKNEYHRGKVDPSTVKQLRHRIEGDRQDVNILMCHHHPIEWTHLSMQDTSHMQGGDNLLRTLEEVDPGGWLVLHGHRHTPALGYAGDTGSPTARMSAGSLGISLPQEGRTDKRNQFYMLEFDRQEIAELELAGAGRFQAWDWNREEGMTKSSPAASIPGTGGFGFRCEARTLARHCRERAEALGRRTVTMDELIEADRRWRYVAPRDLLMLRTVLESLGADVEPRDGDTQIASVAFP